MCERLWSPPSLLRAGPQGSVCLQGAILTHTVQFVCWDLRKVCTENLFNELAMQAPRRRNTTKVEQQQQRHDDYTTTKESKVRSEVDFFFSSFFFQTL